MNASALSSVTLQWDPNPESDIAGYRVYYGTESGTYPSSKDVGVATIDTLSDLADEQIYYFVVTAYNSAGLESLPSSEVASTTGTTGGTNIDPVVYLTSPLEGASLTAPAEIMLEASASDADGTINKIEFFNGAILIGEDTSAPFSYVWAGVTAGSYEMSARAYDNQGASSASASTTIIVSDLPPPPVPSPLTATVASTSAIALAWSDNGDDEDGFKVERRLDSSSSWSEITALSLNVTSFTDLGLDPSKTFHYRVQAFNAKGASDYSNEVAATTDSLPAELKQYITLGTLERGSISAGTFLHTRADDDQVQAITEAQSGGKPAKRYSMLEYIWKFSLLPGQASTLHGNVYSSVSSDGDAFQFDYSLDDGLSWTPLFTVVSTDRSNQQNAPIPAAAGDMLVRVTDTNRTPGNLEFDTIFVDQLYVQTRTVEGALPVEPNELEASAPSSSEMLLNWKDNSSDEFGFEIDRLIEGGNWQTLAVTAADVSTFADNSVLPATRYSYRVRAYNGSGRSGDSNISTAIIQEGILLKASWSKVQGRIEVQLDWTGSKVTENVEVYRDGTKLTTVSGTEHYTDRTGIKGSFSLTYWICTNGTQCSNRLLLEPSPASAGGSTPALEPASLPYSEWKLRHFGTVPVADDADTDGDGSPTLTEFAFGTDPLDGTSKAQPKVGLRDGVLNLYYSNFLRPGIRINLETSENLLSWQPAADPITTTAETATSEPVVWKVGSTKQQYFRYRVSRAE